VTQGMQRPRSIPRVLSSRRRVHLRDLLWELVVRDMKLRYERSLLGVLWALVNPTAQLMVFVVIFQHVIRLEIENYPLFVFCGVIAWNWTRDALIRSAQAITGNRDLIRQPGFPLFILPVVSLATPLIDLLVALPIVVLLMAFSGGEISAALLAMPLVIAVHFLTLQGISYVVAASQVLFRDTAHVLSVALMLGFYLTPIFYAIDDVPAGLRGFYVVNPMAHLIHAYRSILMHGQFPDPWAMAILTLSGGILCWLGYGIFVRASHRFAEEL